MQIITGGIDGFTDAYPLSRFGRRDGILAVDIETTGLSPEKAKIYLIGCAYWEENHWKTIQWFDDDGTGEADILTSFILFAKRFRVLLHYNGDRFDLPFLSRRIVWNGLQGLPGAQNFPKGMKSADLYQCLKPYQKILSLPDLKQQTVERFFDTGRTEERTGAELIRVYREYLESRGAETLPQAAPSAGEETAPAAAEGAAAPDGEKKDDSSAQFSGKDALLAHNAADLRGLIAVSDAAALKDLFTAQLNVYKAQANTYRNAEGEPVQELWLYARLAENGEFRNVLKKPVTAGADGCFLTIAGDKATIKVPVYNGRAYYYYANYKDYYYLPELDQAIHKSIATFVDSRRREQATARNCYTAKVGQFLPEWGQRLPYEPFFKRSYDDRTVWFTFTDEMKKNRKFFSDYATYVYRHIVPA